jgi:hypothetical protein
MSEQTKYTYSIQTDFPNHKVDSGRLTQEIRASAIIVALDHIDTAEDACDIWFKDILNTGDKTLLDGLVAVHTGEPLPSDLPRTIITGPSGVPVDIANNRMLVVPFPADFGANLWLTGRGDDLEQQSRGTGQALAMTFTGPGEQSVDLQFLEQIQLHDGQLFVQDPSAWDIGDEWDLGVLIPACVPVANPGGTGNCNVVDSGQGFNVVVPAMGDGAYDLDMATAAPLPGGGGYWDYDYYSNALTPSKTPGSASYNLISVDVLLYSHRSVPIPWHKHSVFDFDAYDAVRISQRWKIRWTVKKLSSGSGKVAGWVVVFRQGIQ